ncbi:hypothetical protein Gpo141_00004947 [Globisporangium polare]
MTTTAQQRSAAALTPWPLLSPLRLLLLGGMLLCVSSLAPPVSGEYVGAASPSGARCRIFVHATHVQTRFVLVESYADQDGVEIFDDFPVVEPALSVIPLEDVYKKLRPSFLKIQEFLLAREKPLVVEPRHCHTHLVTSGPSMRALEKTQLDAIYARIHQDTIEDAQFPFLLARDDLRTIPAELQSYFLIIGTNFLDGKIVGALSPGKEELYGLLSFNAYSAEMVFDNLERWRRTKRQKQTHIPLNISDFFSREYAGHGRNAISDAVSKELREIQVGSDVLQHPCFFKGYVGEEDPGKTEADKMLTKGMGNAQKCIKHIQTHVDKGNAACPEGSFCALNGLAQPKSLGSFYGAGLFRTVVVYTNKVLQMRQAEDTNVKALELPTPTLAALRVAADTLCALPYSYVQGSKVAYGDQKDGEKTACLDLCYAIVLLKQFGIAEDLERVHFVSQYEKSPVSTMKKSSTPEEQVTWLTGAFLYLEALHQRKAFAVEAEILAVQVDEGVPIGFNLSMLLFVVAVGFLYWTTGARRSSSLLRKKSGYQRVVNGVSGKAKQQHEHSTQAILFIDDASE